MATKELKKRRRQWKQQLRDSQRATEIKRAQERYYNPSMGWYAGGADGREQP